MSWRPGLADAWRWAEDAQTMLIDALVWLGIVAVVVVGVLALVAVLGGGRD